MNEINFTQLANFQDKQKEAWKKLFAENCKYLLYGGAASGGKSYFLRWAAVGLGIYYAAKYHISGIPIGLFSEDYPTLKDRQIARIKREFPSYLGELKDTRDEGYVYQISEKYGGAKILLRNLDDPSKYASTEFAAELVEELTKNELQTFEDLRFRLRYPGIPDPRFVGASNPGSIGHEWVRRYFIDKKAEHEEEQDKFFYIPATVYDNKYVDPAYVEQLKSLPEAKRKAFLEGSWDVFAGQVFSEFSRLKHTIKPMVPNASLDHYLSMDWGYSDKSAFAAYLHCVLKMKTDDGQNFTRVITYREWYGNNKTPREWAGIIYQDCERLGIKPIRGYGDPAIFNTQTDGSKAISKLFEEEWKNQEGEHWINLSPGGKNRIARVATVHNWLSLSGDQLPYWMITESCPNLIRTLPTLVYDDNKIDDVDTSQEDHAYDAIGYFLSEVKFIQVKAGAHTYGSSAIIAPQRFNEKNEDMGIGNAFKEMYE